MFPGTARFGSSTAKTVVRPDFQLSQARRAGTRCHTRSNSSHGKISEWKGWSRARSHRCVCNVAITFDLARHSSSLLRAEMLVHPALAELSATSSAPSMSRTTQPTLCETPWESKRRARPQLHSRSRGAPRQIGQRSATCRRRIL